MGTSCATLSRRAGGRVCSAPASRIIDMALEGARWAPPQAPHVSDSISYGGAPASTYAGLPQHGDGAPSFCFRTADLSSQCSAR